MESFWAMLASFLGGSFLTAITFVLGFSNRLTKVEATLASLCKTFEKLEAKEAPPCIMHGAVVSRLDMLESRIRMNQGKQ